MRMKFNEFLATTYASLFQFSLKPPEATLWGVGLETRPVSHVVSLEKFLNVRKIRYRSSYLKRKLAERIVAKISKIPTIRAVFLTGSVAVWNASSKADVDLMIITAPNTVWITRIMVVGLLKVMQRYRSKRKVADKVCTNIFLDIRHLEVQVKNLYTAHEVLQAECLFDAGGVEDCWLTTNLWAGRFLPVVYKERQKQLKREKNFFRRAVWEWVSWFLVPLEGSAFVGQFLYMRSKMTREEVGWGKAIFHPNDLTAKVFKKWQKKLHMFGYNESQAKAFFFGP